MNLEYVKTLFTILHLLIHLYNHFWLRNIYDSKETHRNSFRTHIQQNKNIQQNKVFLLIKKKLMVSQYPCTALASIQATLRWNTKKISLASVDFTFNVSSFVPISKQPELWWG